MASVDWKKGKSKTQIKSVFRHCQTDERLKNKHSNLDINKSLTAKNAELSHSGYTAVCKAFDDRLAEIDSKATKTPRKDRVECLFLNIPAPEKLAKQDTQEWFNDVHSRLCDRFGKDNVIMATVHYDEIHAYTDAETGEERLSRPHMHVALIPEIDGRLCAKQVSSRQNMVGLNNDIDRLSRQKYGVNFMDGTKRKSYDSVESLKNQSLRKENERLETENKRLETEQEELERSKTTLAKERHALEAKSDALRAKEQELAERERVIQQREQQLQQREQQLQQREQQLQQREQQLQQREQQLQQREQQLQQAEQELAQMVQLNTELQRLIVTCREESRKKAAAME